MAQTNSDYYLGVIVDFNKQSVKSYFSTITMKNIVSYMDKNKNKKLKKILDQTIYDTTSNVIHNCLLYSIHFGNSKTTKMILKNYYSKETKLDINKNQSEAFKCVIHYDKKDIIGIFLKLGADIHVDNEIALIKYCIKNDYAMVKLLLENGADMYADSNIALTHCTTNGNMDIINLFIAHGLSKITISELVTEHPDNITNFDLAMLCASKNRYADIVSFMLRLGANPNINNSEALVDSACDGFHEIVKILLQFGANPNARNGEPLKQACINGHLEVVKMLVNEKDMNNQYVCDLAINDSAAIRWAAYKGHYAITKILLESNRCDVCANNNEAYELALKYNHTQIIALLEGEKT